VFTGTLNVVLFIGVGRRRGGVWLLNRIRKYCRILDEGLIGVLAPPARRLSRTPMKSTTFKVQGEHRQAECKAMSRMTRRAPTLPPGQQPSCKHSYRKRRRSRHRSIGAGCKTWACSLRETCEGLLSFAVHVTEAVFSCWVATPSTLKEGEGP